MLDGSFKIIPLTAACLLASACENRTPQAKDPAAAPSAQSSPGSKGEAALSDPVQQVLANLKNQPVGSHTAAVYNLPGPYLRVVAERIVRASYEDNFRIVVNDGTASPQRASGQASDKSGDQRLIVRVLDHHPAPVNQRFESQAAEVYPPLIGYRATILKHDNPWPFDAPASDAPPKMRAAYDIVATRLAIDGLLLTTAKVIAAIGQDQFDDASDRESARETLRAAGLPVELLEFFKSPQHADAVQWIAQQLLAGKSPETLQQDLAKFPFEFQQTRQGFQVATESGEHEIAAIRLQLTRGGYWRTIGDGGNVDLTRQLIEQLPGVSFIASIERRHADEFVALARSWHLPHESQLTVMRENLPVAQWAHDNGKGGLMPVESGTMQAVTLVPRYASRGEIGAALVAGETLLLDGLPEAGQTLIQSPLHFQGGNLLAVRNPANGERILFIGEAEILRNQILGLSLENVLAAFQIEFGVDRCETLPVVSFHIDYDVCFRAVDGKMFAFVNDTPRACRIILERAVQAMQSSGALDQASSQSGYSNLQNGRWREFLKTIGRRITAMGGERGRFPASFAEIFSTSESDSGIGNLHLILQAIDTMSATALPKEEWPRQSAARQYFELLARREKARIELRDRLGGFGFTIVEVPGLADQFRGVNYLNGVHAKNTYVMPAYGGLMRELDLAARRVFESVLGSSTQIRMVNCAESQRRAGAVHCSASVLYRP